MHKVLFVTGNKRKIWQANDTLRRYGIETEPVELDIQEIQSHNPIEITVAKAHEAYKQSKRSLVVCDHTWSIPALKGFPGGYMKDINLWFEPEDWLALMKDKSDRRAILIETVVYYDGENEQQFSVEFQAKFIDEARGKGTFSGERVVIFDGFTETIAERIDAGEHARDMHKSAWQKFGEWYSDKNGAWHE